MLELRRIGTLFIGMPIRKIYIKKRTLIIRRSQKNNGKGRQRNKKKKKIPQIKGSYPTTSSQSIIHKIIQRNILISNEEFFFDNYHNSYNT